MKIQRQRAEWDALAADDPMWAILSDPAKRGGHWKLSEFLATRQADIGRILEERADLGLPSRRQAALDFGCGIGRLTVALADQFEHCVGVDVSPVMIERARDIHRDRSDVEFVVNDAGDLRRFGDGSFDFAISLFVLQHIPERRARLRFLRELCRVLRPGGMLVVQLPSRIPWRHRIQLRPRLYRTGRRVGVGEAALARRGLVPISMGALSTAEVRGAVEGAGARIVKADDELEPGGIVSTVYTVTA